MRTNYSCGFGGGPMHAVAGIFGSIVLLAAIAAAQSVPQNMGGRIRDPSSTGFSYPGADNCRESNCTAEENTGRSRWPYREFVQVWRV